MQTPVNKKASKEAIIGEQYNSAENLKKMYNPIFDS